MTAREFIYKVAQMRQAQKDYFNQRSPQILRAAIRLEHEVDKELDTLKSMIGDDDLEWVKLTNEDN
jgi:hypothetical protein